LLQQAATLMRLTHMPELAMANLKVPNAWAHMRHVVLTPALLTNLSDDELLAILAHELYHWDRGHAVGTTFVSACAWPIVVLYNLASWLSGDTLEVDVKGNRF